jgi:hypothetical protein
VSQPLPTLESGLDLTQKGETFFVDEFPARR